MNQPQFSVVVPLYNKAPYIVQTLRSVLAQAHAALDIIVVDDGSRDNGPQLVESLGHPNITLVRQSNAGVACARNAGIAQARGSWVAFLDADDWWHPLHLQRLAELITQHPQVDMVATQYQSMHYSGDTVLQPWALAATAQHELIDDLPRRWLQGSCFFTSSVAVKSTRLQALQPCFPPGESFGEDLDLWFRLAELGPIALTPLPLVARLWVPDGLSVLHDPKRESPFINRLAQRLQRGAVPARLRGSTQRFIEHNLITQARTAITLGDRALAWQFLSRSRHGLPTKRWLSTLLMMMLPGGWVYRWQTWRKRRKMFVA